MSLNLHAIVRGAISSVNADEQVYLLQSTGNTNVSGRIVATYAGPQLVGAQVQTLSNDDLKIVSETERTERDRKFYLFSDSNNQTTPAAIIRNLGRTGDFIYRPYDSTYWKIYCVAEDFSPVGWVQVLASQQSEVPTALKDLMEDILNPDSGDDTPDTPTDPTDKPEEGANGN